MSVSISKKEWGSRACQLLWVAHAEQISKQGVYLGSLSINDTQNLPKLFPSGPSSRAHSWSRYGLLAVQDMLCPLTSWYLWWHCSVNKRSKRNWCVRPSKSCQRRNLALMKSASELDYNPLFNARKCPFNRFSFPSCVQLQQAKLQGIVWSNKGSFCLSDLNYLLQGM